LTLDNNHFKIRIKKKLGPKPLYWKIAWILLISSSIIIISYIWLVPEIIRWGIEQKLSEICGGPAHVGQFRISRSGHIFLDSISIYNKSKQKWLSVGKINVALSDWPSLSPTIGEVQIDALNLQLLSTNGIIDLPQMKLPDSPNKTQEDFPVPKIIIEKAGVLISDEQDSQILFDNMTFSMNGTNDIYEFQLNQTTPEKSQILSADGHVNFKDGSLDVSLQIDRQFTKPEMKLAFMALDEPNLSAAGRLSANLTVKGSLNKPTEIQSGGSIEFSNGSVFYKEHRLTNNLAFKARLNGQQLDVNEYKATVCDGSAKGQFHAKLKDGQYIVYQGYVLALDVNYPKIMSMLEENAKVAATGRFSGNYAFSGRYGDSNSLDGKGLILLKNIDISILPVIPTIFKYIGLSKLDPLKTSDAEAEFFNKGPLITIKEAHISNPFAAIEFESGGTVNLHTEQIDGHIVAAPLNQVAGLFEQLPVIEIFANLKNNLTRLRIKGNWSDPPAKLIKKEPIEDLRDSTIGFIRDVAKTGGRFGQGMIDGLSNLLKAGNKENK
jgi:hypothetical protein